MKKQYFKILITTDEIVNMIKKIILTKKTFIKLKSSSTKYPVWRKYWDNRRPQLDSISKAFLFVLIRKDNEIYLPIKILEIGYSF